MGQMNSQTPQQRPVEGKKRYKVVQDPKNPEQFTTVGRVNGRSPDRYSIW